MLVFFDLPTETRKDRRNAALFRKDLIRDGFSMMQFSVYARHCSSAENLEVHRRRVITSLPPKGNVNILAITDKQFERMEMFFNTREKKKKEIPQQLELF